MKDTVDSISGRLNEEKLSLGNWLIHKRLSALFYESESHTDSLEKRKRWREMKHRSK